MITRALLSVSDKTGLIEFATFLAAQKIELLSTGGTAKALRDAGLAVVDVSNHTGFPEIMDGRVKTLHPKIHGGLLAVRDDAEHKKAMQKHDIAPIDLVVINLYPFEATVKKGAGFAECIENIDIGGPSMVRSSAKNHAYVTVLTDPADYAAVMEEMKANKNATLPETRKKLAAKAFARTAAYDAAISGWFAGALSDPFPERFTVSGVRMNALHYGENPHQQAAFYATGEEEISLASAKQVQGAALSYNNLNDASAAFELVREFSEPAVAIIKHANPCGVAVGSNLVDAFTRALACDPVSAYGGIIAVNRPIDEAFVAALGKLFLEVMIAPAADDAALAALSGRKKLKLLLTGSIPEPASRKLVKSISGGFLVQDEDSIVTRDAPKTVTKKPVSNAEMDDLQFAFTVAKHVKSNAIVLVKDKATIGIGAGQMSRIDSTRIACIKAAEAGISTQGSVLASDAFFPFADNVELAAKEGIAAIIQPGGSIRDEDVISKADEHDIGMVFTGIRHFRH
ncbi:MAG: bifunctional phosphoribosylaminoimidazolecarboxamide formyltransferase/IMP cyclohydrolase [Alphaproteobacteria bacterium]|nr:bifunctional phosphoribosylaminoimidazolecarboxamide formyltransferase/IMP cyclohydrolase [Alphaproteobacteria bacterium]